MNLDRNKASIVEAIDAGLLAGAVTLVWRSGEVLQVNELGGYRDVEAQLPMQRDTIFRIASMTKPVTVAAAMSLIEEASSHSPIGSRRGCPNWRTCGCWWISAVRWTARFLRSATSRSRI